MNPTAIVGALVVAFVAVAGYLGKYTLDSLMASEQANGSLTCAVKVSELNTEFMKKTSETASKVQKEHDDELAIRDEEKRDLLEQNDDLFRDIENRIRHDAEAVDNDLMREFAASLCKVAAGRDNSARETCDIRAAEADFTEGSAFVSINPKRIEDWNVLCRETGEKFYCDYAATVITGAALKDLKDWIGEVDFALLEYDASYDTIVTQINEILAMPGPTIGAGDE